MQFKDHSPSVLEISETIPNTDTFNPFKNKLPVLHSDNKLIRRTRNETGHARSMFEISE